MGFLDLDKGVEWKAEGENSVEADSERHFIFYPYLFIIIWLYGPNYFYTSLFLFVILKAFLY